jgi:transcriptional regulator with XRE-family HTH domain
MTEYISLPADDDPPPIDRISPDRELLRAAREAAGLSQKTAGRVLAAALDISPGSGRTRLQNYENGRDKTLDVDAYEVLRDWIAEALPERDPLAAALSTDAMAATWRAHLHHTRYRIVQREAAIRRAEEHLDRLRAGLQLVRASETSLVDQLRELDAFAAELR